MFKEFREFAIKGNVLDMAVGIIIGAAFGTLIASFVSDLLMPPIGLLLGHVDFANLYITLRAGSIPGPYASLAQAQAAGAVTLNYGAFVDRISAFLIVVFALFLVVRGMNRLKRKAEAPAPAAAPATKECPYCCTTVAIQAVRCPNCTSEIK
jgi:large conductance mechanosensitive channel